MPGISRKAGRDSTANISDAQDDQDDPLLRDREFSVVQDVIRRRIVRGRVKEGVKIAGVRVGVCHRLPPFMLLSEGWGLSYRPSGGPVPPPGSSYWALMAMRLTPARGFSDFGSDTVSTPFLNEASALRNYTSFGPYRPAALRNHQRAKAFFELAASEKGPQADESPQDETRPSGPTGI